MLDILLAKLEKFGKTRQDVIVFKVVADGENREIRYWGLDHDLNENVSGSVKSFCSGSITIDSESPSDPHATVSILRIKDGESEVWLPYETLKETKSCGVGDYKGYIIGGLVSSLIKDSFDSIRKSLKRRKERVLEVDFEPNDLKLSNGDVAIVFRMGISRDVGGWRRLYNKYKDL